MEVFRKIILHPYVEYQKKCMLNQLNSSRLLITRLSSLVSERLKKKRYHPRLKTFFKKGTLTTNLLLITVSFPKLATFSVPPLVQNVFRFLYHPELYLIYLQLSHFSSISVYKHTREKCDSCK